MKSYNYVVAAFLLILTTLLAACSGSGSTTAASGTGAVSAKLVWDNAKATGKSVASAPVGVVTVRLAISGATMTTMQQDFPASSGSGQIDNVPVGNGLTLTAMGLNALGIITHQGAVTNVTIEEGQTKYVGTITMSSTTLIPTLVSIFITPANPSISAGATRQFTATGTYSDNSTKDLTPLVAWSSSDTSVTTIETSGIATALNAGSATIFATLGSVTGSTTLVVNAVTYSYSNYIKTANAANTPVVGVDVYAIKHDNGVILDHVTSDASGFFTSNALPGGAYVYFLFSKTGYLSTITGISWFTSNLAPPAVINWGLTTSTQLSAMFARTSPLLTQLPNTGFINGWARDSITKTAFAGATLTATDGTVNYPVLYDNGTNLVSGSTFANGNFFVMNIPDGKVVTVSSFTNPSGAYNRRTYHVAANCMSQGYVDIAPVNGICGTATGGTFAVAPTANLCSRGTASSVTGIGPWGWVCQGIYGGSNSNCSSL